VNGNVTDPSASLFVDGAQIDGLENILAFQFQVMKERVVINFGTLEIQMLER
jgi:hypothetical protein